MIKTSCKLILRIKIQPFVKYLFYSKKHYIVCSYYINFPQDIHDIVIIYKLNYYLFCIDFEHLHSIDSAVDVLK